MRKLYYFLASIIRDAPIIGYLDYLTYRLRSILGNKTPMMVTIEGQDILVRPGTPDLRVAFQSLGSELNVLSELLPKNFDGLIIDAGGYIGTAALTLANMFPAATIVSVEASSSNFEVLKRNVASMTNIVPMKAALHSEPNQFLDLVDRGTGAWGFSIAVVSRNSGTYSEKVRTVTLTEISNRFPEKPIGIIKMDIEGGEHILFSNYDEVLERAQIVFIELHDRIVPGCTELFRAFSLDRWLLNVGGEKLLSLRRAKPD